MTAKDFRQFRYFVTTAEELHFAKAAERLGIAQPALSQQIKALETQLGAPLFNREKRRVELTEMGRVFLEDARATLAVAESATRRARGMARGESGNINIGIVGSVMFEPHLPHLLGNYCSEHQNVKLSLSEMPVLDQIEAVKTHRLDFAIVREPLPEQLLNGIESFVLSSQRLVAALPENHLLAKRKFVRLAELAQEPFVGFSDPDGIGMHQTVLDICRKTGFEPQFSQRVADLTTIISLVAAGFGVCLVVDIVRHLKIPNVIYVPLKNVDVKSNLIVVHRRFERSATVAKLLERVREYAKHVVSTEPEHNFS